MIKSLWRRVSIIRCMTLQYFSLISFEFSHPNNPRTAIFTILFGWISDTKGYNFALFVCFGLSIVGAFVNVPLIFNKRLGRKEIGNGYNSVGNADCII